MNGPKTEQVTWPTPTLPLVNIAFRGPAYDDQSKDHAALDIISTMAFSSNSPLYRQLVLTEQKADELEPYYPNKRDPQLFEVMTRVKKPEDVKPVEERVLATFSSLKDTLVDAKELARVKQRLRYELALSMDNSEAIARTLAGFIALRRTPETINTLYDTYDKITPEDIREVARKYFTEKGRVVVTLTGGAK